MKIKKLLILFLILSAALLSLTACTREKNPDLEGHLNQLVEAEMRGEAKGFAAKSNIELVDGKVRVVIMCEPGQVEVAAESATKAGAELGGSYKDLLEAFVPITSLNKLSKARGVKYIRLPYYAEDE